MRAISILLSLLLSLAASAQTIEIITPAALDADRTGTWKVIVTNPGSTPTFPTELMVSFTPFSAQGGEVLSVPPGCRIEPERRTTCPATGIAPGERRLFEYRVRLGVPYAEVFTYATYGPDVNAAATAVFGRPFPVTNTNDDGPGSLRQAIADMNQSCTVFEPCQPLFRIDGPVPVEGWFTIRPLSPLPPVTAPITVFDGRTQALHTGETNPAGPELMLHGSAAGVGHGLQFNSVYATITDLAVGNFPGNGIASTARTQIRRSHLGMDPSGLRRAPNGTRGAQIEGDSMEIVDNLFGGNFRSGAWFDSSRDVTITRNRFVDNGASGFYARITPGVYNRIKVEDNVITGNAHAGISLDRQSIGNYAKNHFAGNLGRAIDIGIDGETFAMVPGLPGSGGIVGAPVDSLRYENGETVIEAHLAPRNPFNIPLGEMVHFYASPVPKDGGELLGAVRANPGGTWSTFTLRVPRDLRGQWISASTFVIYIYNWDDAAPGTSEIGAPRLVE